MRHRSGGLDPENGLGQQDRCASSNSKGHGVKRRIPATWMSGSKKNRVSIGRKRKPGVSFFFKNQGWTSMFPAKKSDRPIPSSPLHDDFSLPEVSSQTRASVH